VSKEYWQNAQHIIPQTGHEENLLAAGQVWITNGVHLISSYSPICHIFQWTQYIFQYTTYKNILIHLNKMAGNALQTQYCRVASL
jgi:hypothetical protein